MSGDAVTPGGILAPADAVDNLQKITGSVTGEVYDTDGKRRVVLTRDDTKLIDRNIVLVNKLGIGFVYCCSQHPVTRFITNSDELKALGATEPVLKPGWKPRCLKLIIPETENTYACECTRVHIQRQRGPARRII